MNYFLHTVIIVKLPACRSCRSQSGVGASGPPCENAVCRSSGGQGLLSRKVRAVTTPFLQSWWLLISL